MPITLKSSGKNGYQPLILPVIDRHTVKRVNSLTAVTYDNKSKNRVVQHHLEEFCRQFKHALVSRQIFGWLQQTPPHVLTDIQRAARFYYLQKMSFGGKVSGQTFGTSAVQPPRLNLLRLEEDLSQAHLCLSRVTIEHLDWQRCVEKYDRPETLFFADPPYWKTEGYGVDFPLEQYHALAEAMRTITGKMILTVNDHPDMRKVFAGFTIKTVGINYTVGGAGKGEGRKELIIRSW